LSSGELAESELGAVFVEGKSACEFPSTGSGNNCRLVSLSNQNLSKAIYMALKPQEHSVYINSYQSVNIVPETHKSLLL
jgi:hypothetical protein